MSIITDALERFSRREGQAKKYKIPYTIDGLWLAGCYAFKNKEQDRKVIMPYFKDHKYVDYVVGDIVPIFRLKAGVAYYKITSLKKYPGSDPAQFDDKREYDLKFSHIERTGDPHDTTA